MNPKLIAILFLAAVAAGVLIHLLRNGGAPCGCGRKPSGRDRNGNRKPMPLPGTLDPNGTGEVELYVGNLSFDMNDAQLRSEFAKFGVVTAARVVTNRGTGRSKGFGFVTMPHRQEAAIAVKALDNAEIMGRRMRVNEARGNGN